MTIRQVPQTDLQYYLLAFDKNGVEQGDPDAGGGKLSEKALDALAGGVPRPGCGESAHFPRSLPPCARAF